MTSHFSNDARAWSLFTAGYPKSSRCRVRTSRENLLGLYYHFLLPVSGKLITQLSPMAPLLHVKTCTAFITAKTSKISKISPLCPNEN